MSSRPRAPRVRAVCFDLGGTLIDECDPVAWADVARACDLTVDPEAVSHFFEETERANDAVGNRWTPLEFWARVLEGAAERPVPPETVERFVERLRAQSPPPRLYSDVRRCLEELHHRRLPLGVISNSRSEESVRVLLDRAGILRHFSVVVSSGTEGVAKPDPEIFRRAAARFRLPPEEIFYVGNLPHVDALAARRAGMASVWLHRSGTGFGEDPPEITSLSELPATVAGTG